MTPYLVSYIYLILSYILIGWLAGWLVAATSVNQIRWNDDNVWPILAVVTVGPFYAPPDSYIQRGHNHLTFESPDTVCGMIENFKKN